MEAGTEEQSILQGLGHSAGLKLGNPTREAPAPWGTEECAKFIVGPVSKGPFEENGHSSHTHMYPTHVYPTHLPFTTIPCLQIIPYMIFHLAMTLGRAIPATLIGVLGLSHWNQRMESHRHNASSPPNDLPCLTKDLLASKSMTIPRKSQEQLQEVL